MRKTIKFTSTLAAAALATILLTSSSLNRQEKQIAATIDSICTEMFPDSIPGAAIIVMKGDKIIFDKGYGIADMTTGARINGNTFFNIASCSKQFTAVAILQLAEKGLLSINDPLTKFCPEYKSKIFEGITLHHLLCHTSGLPDKRGNLTREQRLAGNDSLAIEFFKTLDEVEFKPGERYSYKNPTYVLLARIVERVSGVQFDKYVRDNIFTPAGMKQSLYFDPATEDRIPNSTHAYEFDKSSGKWMECDYGESTFFATKPDGGIYTSTHELVQWEKALRKCKVLKKETIDLAQSRKILMTKPIKYYGYGWAMTEPEDSYKRSVWHTGGNGAYSCFVERFPNANIFIAVLANRSYRSGELKAKIEELMGL